MKILVINGPNLNMLGKREPGLYGTENYESLVEKIRLHSEKKNVETVVFQSNHEGAIIDTIQDAWGRFDGIVINAGAYSHTSIAILDALKSVSLPVVEVHITDISKREEFRHFTYTGLVAEKSIIGHGTDGYLEAIDYLINR